MSINVPTSVVDGRDQYGIVNDSKDDRRRAIKTERSHAGKTVFASDPAIWRKIKAVAKSN